jgi:hypothetical protein
MSQALLTALSEHIIDTHHYFTPGFVLLALFAIICFVVVFKSVQT